MLTSVSRGRPQLISPPHYRNSPPHTPPPQSRVGARCAQSPVGTRTDDEVSPPQKPQTKQLSPHYCLYISCTCVDLSPTEDCRQRLITSPYCCNTNPAPAFLRLSHPPTTNRRQNVHHIHDHVTHTLHLRFFASQRLQSKRSSTCCNSIMHVLYHTYPAPVRRTCLDEGGPRPNFVVGLLSRPHAAHAD